jgi:tol-pal system protein YbgF
MVRPLVFSWIAAAALAGAPALVSGTALAQAAPKPVGSFAVAQNYYPPAPIPGAGASPDQGDSASLLLRIDRLEDQVRSLNGEIEQLQFTQKKLEDALQKFQQDVDFRFDDRSKAKPAGRPPLKRGAADEATGRDTAALDAPSGSARSPRADAFDPAADPDAPGAPKSLGSLSPDAAGRGAALDRAPGAPLQLDNGPEPTDAVAADAAPDQAAPGDAAADDSPPPARPANKPRVAADDLTALAGAAAESPREDYDLALVSYNNGHFAEAGSSFQSFLERHPKDRLAPDALYFLGESYWRQGKTREAAQQYLKISTAYPRSPHAPESLLKLGVALEKLGSKDQACASFQQIAQKYPTAAAAIRSSAERSLKRDQC